jgi:hypothetical protein
MVVSARPPSPPTLAMAARRHAQVRQVALVFYLQCQPAGPSLRRVHISRCWLPATSAVAMRCPGLPWLGQHSPYAYAVWSCQITLAVPPPRCMLLTPTRPISASGTPDGSTKPLPSSAAESQSGTANGEAAVPISDFQRVVSLCHWVEQ